MVLKRRAWRQVHRALLTMAVLCLTASGCGKSTPPRRDATVEPAPDSAEPDAVIDAPEAASAVDGRSGIGGGQACDASEQCLGGVCTLGICGDWRHAMRIGIDTTASGADVSEEVVDFPLLVRLGGGVHAFDFSDTQSDGRDVRFVDASGRNLAYQIERWSPDQGRAELWVNVPRIVGNSRANVVAMYWGNEFPPPVSSGKSVFGTYRYAYHFDAMGADTGKQVTDDSGHGDGGTSSVMSPADPRAAGVIASGMALDGSTGFLQTPATEYVEAVSVSLWFKAQPGAQGGLAAFARLFGGAWTVNHALSMIDGGMVSFSFLHGSARAAVTSLTSYDDAAWHFVTARLSSAGQYLFVDGEVIADDPTMNKADLSQQSNWLFGDLPPTGAVSGLDGGVSSSYFSGTLDEIRIRFGEESAAWIKLSYATQRPGSNAVVYDLGP